MTWQDLNFDWDQYKCAAMYVKRGHPQAEELSSETGLNIQHMQWQWRATLQVLGRIYRSTSNKIQETRRTTTKEFLQMAWAMLSAIWDVQYNVDAICICLTCSQLLDEKHILVFGDLREIDLLGLGDPQRRPGKTPSRIRCPFVPTKNYR